jgi:hypothetical protein
MNRYLSFPAGERRPLFVRGTLLAAGLVSVFLAAPVAAQPPAPPNPQAPVLNRVPPLGAQRGTTIELTLTGTNLAGPTGFWTSFPARVTIPTDGNNGKDNARLRVVVDLPRDAPLGFHSVGLATTRGMSNLQLFCIDDLPQILEVDTNRSRTTAQAVPIPCVVVGRADPEVSDYFKVSVKAGERVSFEVLGRRLGSAFDPQLTLFDARTGKELAGGHNNDAPGLQTDARLTYTFREAGDYLVEVRDVLYHGGGDFWYRLRIGDFPCATTPVPMAIHRGSQRSITFAGTAVEGVQPVEVVAPSQANVDTVWLAPRGANGLYGWPVALAVRDHEERLEQEPNDEPGRANRIPVPGGMTGKFLTSGDVDTYVFAGHKGQRIIVQAETLELGSPTEVYIVLKDAKGTALAASNPMAGARIDFTAPADGDYFLAVEHLLYWAGPQETYHLTVTPYVPAFGLTLGAERFEVAADGVTPVVVQATRQDYGGPILVDVVGSPDVSGHAVIESGQATATLFLRARADAPLAPCRVRVRGAATINGRTVTHDADLRAVVSRNLGGLPYPPRDFLHALAVAVTEKAPFRLAVRTEHAEAARGTPAPLTVTAYRSPGFTEEIALAPVGLPPNVAPALKNIPKGQNEVKVQLNAALNATLGRFPISLTGKAKFQNREFDATAEPVDLVLALPFDLKVEPAAVKLTAGGKAMVKVTAVRRGGYAGPVALELRNLPAGVMAAKGTVTAGQTGATIELTAAANAALGDKAGVEVVGTATAAGNQQNASPGFTVSIGKK